uniref:AAA+ ATPase domain-containing protein n=1 Tax=viral metagenome TaxID=1070528 RepID=A0A6C0CBN2_9ZZZZ
MESSIPWIEKYRPTELENVIMDDQTKMLIDVLIKKKKNVHLIITGFPGVGKTSTVKCIAKKALGANIHEGFLELNDADTRAKNSSTLVPTFCKRSVNFDEPKIVLLDEADTTNKRWQNELCEFIKLYGKNTRFIFTCNNSAKIIEDIQSICRIIRFKKLSDDQIKNRLIQICLKEKVAYSESGLEMICYISAGDMRKAINNLQMAAFSAESIDKQSVLDVCRMPDPNDINEIIDFCIKKDLDSANKSLNRLMIEGFHYLDIIIGFDYILTGSKIKDEIKLQLIHIVNQTTIVVSTGVRSKLQMLAMLCRIVDIFLTN